MRLILFFALTFSAFYLSAQEKVIPYPHLSPLQKVEILIGIVDFKLVYSRPSIRGRSIFGGLEPYGEMWRTGANKNIKLSFNEPIIVNTDTLPAGTYTIFTKPEKTKWMVYFYDHIDWYGVPDGIDTLPIVSQFEVKSISLKDTVETLDISFSNLSYDGGAIDIKWENTKVIIPFTIPYDDIITTRLDTQRETLASDYAYSANIYLNKKEDPDQALKYLNLCTQTREDGQSFDQWLSQIKKNNLSLPWAHLMKSEIYATQGTHARAIEEAKRSIQIAEIVGSNYYIKENTENINKWKKEK